MGVILSLLRMLATVQFDYQLLFQTDEIYNIAPDRSLSAELVTIHLPQPQMAPKELFGVSKIIS
jgi:hypothetical protein